MASRLAVVGIFAELHWILEHAHILQWLQLTVRATSLDYLGRTWDRL